MQAKVIRRFTTFADYPRYEYLLQTRGILNNMYMGLTVQEAADSLRTLNTNRKNAGVPEIIVDFPH
jgi:hypothetical protein